ncbi:MAG TPA: adenylate/guanylate cyclase domain-containing protein, partial [bacterium]
MPDRPTGRVTFFFTDIEGSTHLLQHLGDDRYAQVLAEQRQIMRASFEAWRGYEFHTEGDAFLVAFWTAADAIGAATEVLRALAVHPWPEGSPVRVRVGLHTGEAALAGGGYIGLDVHRTNRVMSAGYGGQVLLSQAAHDDLADDFPDGVTIRDLGEHRLKDLTHPERLFQLVIPGLPTDFPPPKTLDVVSNNLPVLQTSFIGRERELEEVKQLLGRNRLVTLMGAGGAGKTRLSIQVAADLIEQFKHGAWQVELAPLTDPGLVAPTIASTLGVREVAGRVILDSLIDYLQPKTLLLVMD